MAIIDTQYDPNKKKPSQVAAQQNQANSNVQTGKNVISTVYTPPAKQAQPKPTPQPLQQPQQNNWVQQAADAIKGITDSAVKAVQSLTQQKPVTSPIPNKDIVPNTPNQTQSTVPLQSVQPVINQKNMFDSFFTTQAPSAQLTTTPASLAKQKKDVANVQVPIEKIHEATQSIKKLGVDFVNSFADSNPDNPFVSMTDKGDGTPVTKEEWKKMDTQQKVGSIGTLLLNGSTVGAGSEVSKGIKEFSKAGAAIGATLGVSTNAVLKYLGDSNHSVKDAILNPENIVFGLIGGTLGGVSGGKEPKFELTPEQARTQVEATNLKGTDAGKIILRAADKAEAQGKSLEITAAQQKLFNLDAKGNPITDTKLLSAPPEKKMLPGGTQPKLLAEPNPNRSAGEGFTVANKVDKQAIDVSKAKAEYQTALESYNKKPTPAKLKKVQELRQVATETKAAYIAKTEQGTTFNINLVEPKKVELISEEGAISKSPVETTIPEKPVTPTVSREENIKKFEDNIKNYQSFGGKTVGTSTENAALRDVAAVADTPEVKAHTQEKIQTAITSGEVKPNEDGTITLYRGGTPSTKNGLTSATYDKAIAQDFADKGDGVLHEVKVKPEDIKAFIGKAEKEVLVNNETIKPIETPPTETPVGDGKTPSKIGKSIEQKAIEQGLTKKLENIAGYDKLTIEDQSKRAADTMKNVDEARAILRGEKPLPQGLRGTSLIIAAEEHINRTGDVEMLHDLANSPLVSETSAAAQELRLAAEREPDSLAKQLQDIRKARDENIKKQTGKTPKEAVKSEVENLKTEAKKQLPKKGDWKGFIESIKC